MTQKIYTAPLGLKLGEGDQPGAFRATFATLQVIDKDGDVTRPGAFKQGQRVKIAAWGHDWGALTVGKGVIHADDREAWVDGQFNLNTAAGREHYETVKFNEADQEWSYGFEIKEHAFGEHEGREVRFLDLLDVFEVSPVMLGAGVNTRTDAIKAGERKYMGDAPDGSYEALGQSVAAAYMERYGGDAWPAATFPGHAILCVYPTSVGMSSPVEMAYWDVPYARDADGTITLGTPQQVEPQTEYVPADGKGVLLPLQAWLATAKAGQPQLSAARRERLSTLRTALNDLGAELDALLTETAPKDAGKLHRWLECQRILARRNGVAV